jgi:DNA polymerase elongation subunit (family B)
LNITLAEVSTGGPISLATVENNNSNYVMSNIAVAAAIASKARIKLNQAILEVGYNGGRVLYVDTDSIYAAFKVKMSNIRHGDVF